MRANAIDVVTFFDLDFLYTELKESQIHSLTSAAKARDGKMSRSYCNSFNWLFYDMESTNALPGMERIDVTSMVKDSPTSSASLLIQAEYGVGVLSILQTLGATEDVREAVARCDFDDKGVIDALGAIGFGAREIERKYPFIALTVDTDVSQYIRDNAIELGALLPGGMEHEEEDFLKQPILNDNLSRRSYERLYITWTDALAIYSGMGEFAEEGEPETIKDLTLFRALQIFETCIINRRLLRTMGDEIDGAYSSLRAWRPRPWKVNALVESLIRIRRDLITSPPTQSIEAARLLKAGYAAFNIEPLADTIAERTRLMDTRFQWSKTQFLAGVAILGFLLDKLRFYDFIVNHLHLHKS